MNSSRTHGEVLLKQVKISNKCNEKSSKSFREITAVSENHIAALSNIPIVTILYDTGK